MKVPFLLGDELALEDREADGDGDADEDGLELVDPPASMAHLNLDKYVLLTHLCEVGRNSRGQKLIIGSVNKGPPSSPHQPASCSYLMEQLPTPNLGGIPRNEIFAELNKDDQKDAKQRRDYGFMDEETVP